MILPLDWAARAVARLPQRALLGLGRCVAWLAWPLLHSRRRVAAINIGLCFPGMQAPRQAALVRESIENTVVGLFELVRAWHAPRRTLAGLAQVQGIEHVRDALDRGQGVLLMSGHFTHTELAARFISEALGRPVRGVVRRHNNACMEGWMDASRTSRSGPTIGKKDVRALLRALGSGQAVLYSADQNFTYQNAFVPFFGVPAATLTATSGLVQRSGAVLLPFWCRRNDDGRYVIRIEPTWAGWPSDDAVADAARYMCELETVVRECPGQYLWAHRRFKTRPPGEPPIY